MKISFDKNSFGVAYMRSIIIAQNPNSVNRHIHQKGAKIPVIVAQNPSRNFHIYTFLQKHFVIVYWQCAPTVAQTCGVPEIRKADDGLPEGGRTVS